MAKKAVQQKGKVWLKRRTGKYRGSVVFLACVNAVATALSLTFAFLVRYLINGAASGEEKAIWIFACVLLGVLFFRIFLNTLARYLAERQRAKITKELRTELFGKMLCSQFEQVQAYHSGELLNRLTSDVTEVATDTVGLLPALVGMVVQCFGAIAALIWIDPLFTAIYVVCGGIFGAITAVFRKQIKKRQKQVLETDGASKSFMQESLGAVLTVKAYGAEEKTQEKAGELNEKYYQARMSRNRLSSMMSAMFSLLGNFGLIFAIIWCSVSVLHDGVNADYGAMLSVVLLLMQLQQPFTSFSSWVPIYYARIASGERLCQVDEIPCECMIAPTNDASAYQTLARIEMENVSFTYGRNTVLNHASVTLDKGETVCVTGESGGGKSTLFKLLLSVLTPNNGEIRLVDEQGEKTPLTVKQRGLFAYVPQGKFLFSGTIYENLTFFTQPTGDAEEKVREALRISCAEFVWDLPQGLQTRLGENGVGLSEGQMQRLAVARAILSGRPILLLDEATSALDSQTERRLLENIKTLQNKTCLMVTHRPAALEIADKILTVKDGEIK